VRARLASTDDRRRALLAARTSASAAARATTAVEAEEARLQHRLDILVTATDQLQLEYQKARLAQDLAAGDVRIVDAAPLPYRPDGLPAPGKMALGLFLGLLLGTGTAATLDTMSRVIHRPEEVERLIPVRRLGVIPLLEGPTSPQERLRAILHGRQSLRPRIAETDDSLVLGTEPFRRVYSSLIPGWGDRARTILVTSTMPREGKTLTALNLAVIFAGEGARVLLIDCDVRRPRLHQMFRLARQPGLMEMFAEQPAPTPRVYSMAPELECGPPVAPPDPADRAIQATTVPRLSLLAAGAPLRPMQELKGTLMRELLERLEGRFDVTILDTPPVLVSADASILAPQADGVILVVRAGQTERELIGHGYEQLTAAGGHVLGVVLNDPAGEIPKYDPCYSVYDETVQEAS
jgi:Mrp family chromosome partitioning ATPase